MEPLTALAALATLAGFILAVLNIREKLRPRPAQAHPLEPILRDIAPAIRSLKTPCDHASEIAAIHATLQETAALLEQAKRLLDNRDSG